MPLLYSCDWFKDLSHWSSSSDTYRWMLAQGPLDIDFIALCPCMRYPCWISVIHVELALHLMHMTWYQILGIPSNSNLIDGWTVTRIAEFLPYRILIKQSVWLLFRSGENVNVRNLNCAKLVFSSAFQHFDIIWLFWSTVGFLFCFIIGLNVTQIYVVNSFQ